MKFNESEKLVKTALAHRRMARAAHGRLRRAVRAGRTTDEFGWSVARLIKHIDANRRCSADDFAMAREVAK